MKLNTTITWTLLIVLTIASALVSKMDSTYVVLIILLFSSVKFLGIAFQFMELKKAHVFWKGMIIGFLMIFVSTLLLILG